MMTTPTTPEASLARLRAAAALIPAIEADLATKKLPPDRAALMCEFCAWTTQFPVEGNEELDRLIKAIHDGLARINSNIL